jgi:putative ABC transport system substrate-binding protein
MANRQEPWEAGMRRRSFFEGLVLLSCGQASHAIAQQAGRMVRIGRLSPLSEEAEQPMIDGLRAGLAEQGWLEGRNLAFEMRFAAGHLDRLPALAEDLVRGQVDLIVTGSNPGALAAKRATNKIPVVFVTTGDPVTAGIVPSLARPGGNLTGISVLGLELNAKRVQLLSESFGKLKRVAVLTNPGAPYTTEFRAQRAKISSTLGIDLPLMEVREIDQLPSAFEGLARSKAQGILVLADIMFLSNRQRIVELVAASRLPATYPDRGFVDVGGLMFYGAALPDMYRHAASLVDKILRGARPADLPVQQPTQFRLVINSRTAQAQNLAVPMSLLVRADEVIE